MKVNLTPEEVTVKIEDVVFIFHNINSLTAAELQLAFRDFNKNPKILVQKLISYCKAVTGLTDAQGNQLGTEHFDKLPSSLLYDLYAELLTQCREQGDGRIKDEMEAEEKNSELPQSEDSGNSSSTTQD